MHQPKFMMKVWDAPTRLFHWGIVLLVAAAWLTAQFSWMELHFLAGYGVLTLLLFRIVWGVVGSDTARFAGFVRNPVEGVRHLAHIGRREPDTQIGHNAAGGWMVLIMLALLAVQVGTGLFANDDVLARGPLMKFVSKATSNTLSGLHSLSVNILLAIIGVHVAAVIAYAVLKRQDLVRPMITGRKRLPGAMRAPRMASPVLALAVFAVAVAVVVVLATRV